MADYMFIDLHMHTKYSHEELCDDSPKDIFERAQEYANKFNKKNNCNKKCLISFTDHNSILANIKAKELVSSGKYPNVEFVPGIEFTTNLCEMDQYYQGKRAFTRCHILGYNFDPTDPELLAYSMVTHFQFSEDDNIGMQICAARRNLCEKLNVEIPFTALLSLTQLPNNVNYVEECLNAVMAYFNKIKFRANADEVRTLIGEYIKCINISTNPKEVSLYNPITVTKNEDASSFARLKLSEVARIIKNAGGQVVLAHPGVLRTNLDYLKLSSSKYGDTIRNIKKTGKVILSNCPQYEAVLKEFLQNFENICGFKIDGIERFHEENYNHRLDLILRNICEEQGLIQTGGSDYHGKNFPKRHTIGNVFSYKIQLEHLKQSGKTDGYTLSLRLAKTSASELFATGKLDTMLRTHFIDQNNNYVMWEDVNSAIQNVNSKIKEENNKKTDSELQQEVATYLNNLISIEVKFNKMIELLSRTDCFVSVNMLVELERYVYNLYGPIKKMSDKLALSSDGIDPETSKKLVSITKAIHKKYLKMLELRPNMLEEILSTKMKRYRKAPTFVEKIANITYKEKDKPKDA